MAMVGVTLGPLLEGPRCDTKVSEVGISPLLDIAGYTCLATASASVSRLGFDYQADEKPRRAEPDGVSRI